MYCWLDLIYLHQAQLKVAAQKTASCKTAKMAAAAAACGKWSCYTGKVTSPIATIATNQTNNFKISCHNTTLY